MWDVQPIRPEQGEAWDAFVKSHPLGRAYVTAAATAWWGQRRCRLVRLGAWRGGRIAGGAAVTVKSIRGGLACYARVVSLLPDPELPERSAVELLREATELASAEGAIEAEFRGWAPSMPAQACASAISAALGSQQYAARREVGGTYMVRIDCSDDDLLASFDGKCRNQVRTGVRKGVTVLPVSDPQHVQLFCRCYSAMVARKALDHLEEITAEALLPLVEAGHYELLAATHEGRTLNLALVDMTGTPQYSFGATVCEGDASSVPPTGQALQFGIMRHLRDKGRSFYDLGGAPGPVPKPEHPNYTVWRFKHAFHAPYARVVGIYGRPLSLLGRVAAVVRRAG